MQRVGPLRWNPYDTGIFSFAHNALSGYGWFLAFHAPSPCRVTQPRLSLRKNRETRTYTSSHVTTAVLCSIVEEEGGI